MLQVPTDRPAGPARFDLVLPWPLAGDQPTAAAALSDGIARGAKQQTLHGVTGSGKTVTMAKVIADAGRPALVLAHNKTLAAQLYGEFKEFFPSNAVEYFVSYYDYYQPEAYIARSDTYIEKDSSRNEEIDRMRHAATRALFERRDVLIVASVSCIYGLGAPVDYGAVTVRLNKGERVRRDTVLRHLVDIQYERTNSDLVRGKFRVMGDTLEVQPSYEELAVRVEFFGDDVERITELDPLTGEVLAERDRIDIYPARHFVTPREKLLEAIRDIEAELVERVAELEANGRLLEAQRLRQRTNFDLEMMRETGSCAGIENYSRHLTRRQPGEAPYTLMDFLPDDTLIFVDESHVAVPQIGGMLGGDRSRKAALVEYGFRLPSAFDNRPLSFEEWEERARNVVYVSATPGEYEMRRSQRTVEMVVRPTGLVDPTVEVRPTNGQIDDLLAEVKRRAELGHRSLVTTLTKRFAEDLADYLREYGVKVRYLHSELDALERIEVLRDLRTGAVDVVVGINLLREGLDMPEVALVAILDADKEGFLRSTGSLIQTMGRAARNLEGRVILYADRVTDSMQRAMDETRRRRQKQAIYNEAHHIVPRSIVKAVADIMEGARAAPAQQGRRKGSGRPVPIAVPRNLAEAEREIHRLEELMYAHARNLEFEQAAAVRDQIDALRALELDLGSGPLPGPAPTSAPSKTARKR